MSADSTPKPGPTPKAPETKLATEPAVPAAAESAAEAGESTTQTITEPAATVTDAPPSNDEDSNNGSVVDAVVEPFTLDDAVRALLQVIGVEDETFVKGIEIRPNGTVRLFGVDHSGRTFRFEPLERRVVGD